MLHQHQDVTAAEPDQSLSEEDRVLTYKNLIYLSNLQFYYVTLFKKILLCYSI